METILINVYQSCSCLGNLNFIYLSGHCRLNSNFNACILDLHHQPYASTKFSLIDALPSALENETSNEVVL